MHIKRLCLVNVEVGN